MRPELEPRHAGPARIEGPWPFITRLSYIAAGRRIVLLARQHRKGLGSVQRAGVRPLWRRPGYNWSVGALFALGSLLFMLGSVLSLLPREIAPSSFAANVVFFLGSIPFTLAGYLQHFQSANAPPFEAARLRARPGDAIALIGWYPGNLGWLSTFTQFVGTLAFNVSTFNAIVVTRGVAALDIAVWTPDMVGSVLFLVSGYLAFMETSNGYWSWKPRELAWRIVFVNLLGCVAFLTAGILAYVPEGPEAAWIVVVSDEHLLLGGLGFFIGAVLTMRESRLAA